MNEVTLRPEQIALFLDVDGTLLGIEDHPADVVADEALLELLETLHLRTEGGIALISGRPIADIDRIFAPLQLPAAGAHGAESRMRWGGAVRDPSVRFPEVAERRLRELEKGHEGLLVERKLSGISLHYRGAPHLEKECHQTVMAVAEQLGEEFRIIEGKMVFEIVPHRYDKGKAITEFLTEPPFRGRHPVFIGDDKTDEDGFRIVLAANGLAIHVGEGDTVACRRLPDVGSVRDWLQAIAYNERMESLLNSRGNS